MFASNYISKKIVNSVADSNQEIKSNKEIYIYCIEYLMEQVLFLCPLVLIGALLREVIFSILFYVIFTIFRFTSGGYHAPTPLLCTILSYSTFFITYLIVLFTPDFTPYFWFLSYVLLAAGIALLSPVDNIKKRLPKQRKKLLKKKCRRFIFALAFLDFIFCYTNQRNYYKLITVSCFILLISLFAGIRTNKE